MSVLYLEPRTDKQKRVERLAGTVLVGVTALVATWVLTNDQGEPAMAEAPAPQCEFEDELLVEVVEGGFDLEPGATACIHIDILDDARRPA